jgi:hypothetical protein
MIATAPHRISNELRCDCVREDEIIDEDAEPGTIHDCPTCTTSYVNDNGIWRNVLTLSPKQRRKLTAIRYVHAVTRGMD